MTHAQLAKPVVGRLHTSFQTTISDCPVVRELEISMCGTLEKLLSSWVDKQIAEIMDSNPPMTKLFACTTKLPKLAKRKRQLD